MHFHRRMELKFSGSRARHFLALSGRVAIFRDAALSLWSARAKQVCARSIFEYRMASGIVYRFIYLPRSVSPSVVHAYWTISGCKCSAIRHIRCRRPASLSRADEISRCSYPIIGLQVVSDSQRVFTAQYDGLSLPRPPIIPQSSRKYISLHCITNYRLWTLLLRRCRTLPEIIWAKLRNTVDSNLRRNEIKIDFSVRLKKREREKKAY